MSNTAPRPYPSPDPRHRSSEGAQPPQIFPRPDRPTSRVPGHPVIDPRLQGDERVGVGFGEALEHPAVGSRSVDPRLQGDEPPFPRGAPPRPVDPRLQGDERVGVGSGRAPEHLQWQQPGVANYPRGYQSSASTGWATLGTGEQVELASPAARLGARIIDMIIFFSIAALIVCIAYLTGKDAIGGEDDPIAKLLVISRIINDVSILMTLIGVLALLYEITFVAFNGQTLGKMGTSVRVVRADNGASPGWGKSIIRWLIPTLLAVIPCVGVLAFVSYLAILWDRCRQGWHDKAAGTIVVKVSKDAEYYHDPMSAPEQHQA